MDFVGTMGDGAPVKLLPPANQHTTFYRPDALFVAQPTVSKH